MSHTVFGDPLRLDIDLSQYGSEELVLPIVFKVISFLRRERLVSTYEFYNLRLVILFSKPMNHETVRRLLMQGLN